MLVSVCMITYNHEAFIAEAIESALAQVTSFETELIIAEDGSKDGTRTICEAYEKKYPGKIKLLSPGGNRGMMNNLMLALKACTGKYIAFIEGDDYWTDVQKLQLQVNLMEQNADCALCFHNALKQWHGSMDIPETPFHKQPLKQIHHTEDLLQQWYIPSASVMFRNYPDFVFPEWFLFCKSGDIAFLLLLSLRGHFQYIHRTMSVYRIHDNGISATHRGYDKIAAMVFMYENFNIYTTYKYRKEVKEAIAYEIKRHFPVEDARLIVQSKKNRNIVSGFLAGLRKI
jgi:glycosyltransferase involved in cell wall biosynthesis